MLMEMTDLEKQQPKLCANWKQLDEKLKVYDQQPGATPVSDLDSQIRCEIDGRLKTYISNNPVLTERIEKKMQQRGEKEWLKLTGQDVAKKDQQEDQDQSEDHDSERYDSDARDSEAQDEIEDEPQFAIKYFAKPKPLNLEDE